MTCSTSSTKICFNPVCNQSKILSLHKAWPLRTGDFAQLCDSCSLVYEEGKYCQVFHGKADGWRLCESCKKPLHCGCIASINAFVLLDRGGVECTTCITKHFMQPSKQSLSHVASPPSERFKNISANNWNPIAVPNGNSGQWWHSANARSVMSSQSELYSRIPYEIDQSNGIHSHISAERSAVSSLEQNHGDPSKRASLSSLDQSVFDRSSTLNGGPTMVVALNAARREDRMLDGLQDSYHLLGDNRPVDAKKGVLAESGLKTSAGMSSDPATNSCMSISLQSSSAKDPSIPQHGMVVPYAPYNETNDSRRTSTPQRQTPQPSPSKQFPADPQNGMGSSAESQMRNGKGRVDARGRNQLLPRYWPKISDQELQQISGDSKSLITPLFEKILSASDAGRIGRLVLPKKCAEAYFPTIVSPEGLPLRVQDAKGKEWQFQFRFWPNNNSRMYVLEGVTPCIQDMQLQAGDTVTFSRLDPDGKLVMGFRKTSNAPPSNQDKKQKTGNGASKHGEANFKEVNTWSEADRSGYIAKDAIVPSKRKNSVLSLKSKRLHVDSEDLLDLQLTWEEAQGLLRPAHNLVPIVVVIEGHSFEGYEEPPILGKPAILPTKNFRSSCSEGQEMKDVRLQALLNSSNNVGLKKNKSAKKEPDEIEASEGLDTLANLAILGETLPCTAQPPTTTKHPRHRPGCTCIVCIQPPSGKGPKHSDKCECNVCLTVKRRFRTLMERRAKRPAENELGSSKKKQLKQVDDLATSSNTSCGMNPETATFGSNVDDGNRQNPSSPFKGGIDLNIQPDREDESSPVSGSGGIIRTMQEHSEIDKQQKLGVSRIHRGLEETEKGDGNSVSRSCGQEEGDAEQPIPLSMWIPGASATG